MIQSIVVNFEHPANVGILRYLKQVQEKALLPKSAGSTAFTPFPYPLSVSPEQVDNPYERLGSHPEIVQRLWDTIDGALPGRCRWVVYGNPVLVQPDSGVLFAVAMGTSYALRLTKEAHDEAIREGGRRVHVYNDAWIHGLGPEHDTVIDLGEWGPDWIFGRWLAEEVKWCQEIYNRMAG